ncbi:Uncharacterised protein [Vibrio cholerae]|nr:Uncharacterised protein [Vibrio cholerae]
MLAENSLVISYPVASRVLRTVRITCGNDMSSIQKLSQHKLLSKRLLCF